MNWLDPRLPSPGPCAFCGFPDQRHRAWDTMTERLCAGESAVSVSNDYEIGRGLLRRIVHHTLWEQAKRAAR